MNKIGWEIIQFLKKKKKIQPSVWIGFFSLLLWLSLSVFVYIFLELKEKQNPQTRYKSKKGKKERERYSLEIWINWIVI